MPGDVAGVVADVVAQPVAGLRRRPLQRLDHLTDQISAHVRSLGADAAADAPEHGYRRPAQPKPAAAAAAARVAHVAEGGGR